MGTDEQIMTWIKDTYKMMKGEHDINYEGCVTGKFVLQGGIEGRKEATGLGVFFGVRRLMKIRSFYQTLGLNEGLSGKTIII